MENSSLKKLCGHAQFCNFTLYLIHQLNVFLILFASLNTHSSLVVCIFVIETSNLNKKCGDVDRRRTLLLNTSSGGSVLVSVALQSTLGVMCPVRLQLYSNR